MPRQWRAAARSATPCSPTVEGLENAPRAFIGLLRGDNFGKLQVKLGPDPTAR
jgi:NADPH-dependent curcumin reductase CurA